MGRRTSVLGFAVTLLLLLQACGSERGEEADPATVHEGFVTANGVRLHYMDWGGSGPALVLVHGFGVSPSVFADFAPLLRDDFRVVSYARRGHGQSDAPDGPYDNATLVQDLRQFLDSLGITQAHLLGWSMGGNEITEFAARYPDRALKLVYLEAGYDWSDPAFWSAMTALPVAIAPDSVALASLDAYRSWFHGLFMHGLPWSPGLEALLADMARIAPDGRVQVVPGGAANERLMAALASTARDYTGVHAPALALYSATHFDPAAFDAHQAEALTAWEVEWMAPFRRASIARLRRELSDVTVVEMENTTHLSIGLTRLHVLADTVRRFLAERP